MRYVIRGFLASVFLLSGCASTYWVKLPDCVPVIASEIVYTNVPGGRSDYLGFANMNTGVVELHNRLINSRSVLRDCVIAHELKHMQCYTHEERSGYATDCGDGTLVSERFF